LSNSLDRHTFFDPHRTLLLIRHPNAILAATTMIPCKKTPHAVGVLPLTALSPNLDKILLLKTSLTTMTKIMNNPNHCLTPPMHDGELSVAAAGCLLFAYVARSSRDTESGMYFLNNSRTVPEQLPIYFCHKFSKNTSRSPTPNRPKFLTSSRPESLTSEQSRSAKPGQPLC